MKIQFEKKEDLIIFGGILLFVVVIGLVIAGSGDPALHGHELDEVQSIRLECSTTSIVSTTETSSQTGTPTRAWLDATDGTAGHDEIFTLTLTGSSNVNIACNDDWYMVSCNLHTEPYRTRSDGWGYGDVAGFYNFGAHRATTDNSCNYLSDAFIRTKKSRLAATCCKVVMDNAAPL
jgi:hypothetical protein